MKVLFVTLVLFLLSFNAVQAAPLDHGPAVNGQKVLKIIFDVNVGEPAKLLLRLRLIEQTFSELQEAGIAPAFVVAFRGKASRFITRGDQYVSAEDLPYKESVLNYLQRFKEKGFSLEQCAIAANLLRIDTKDFVSLVKVVPNGYISLAGYQSQGYSFIPMD